MARPATPRDYGLFLDPVSAALERFRSIARQRNSNVERLSSASTFIEYKIMAMLHAGDKLRELIAEGTSLVEANEQRTSVTVTIDRAARFSLYVLVDLFLFETGSVRDALIQLANVGFKVGISDDDSRMMRKIREHLRVTDSTHVGLEEWLCKERRPEPLQRILNLRNRATHRTVVGLPEQVSWVDDATVEGGQWRSSVGLDISDTDREPLLDFVDQSEREVSSLVAASIGRLTEHLSSRD